MQSMTQLQNLKHHKKELQHTLNSLLQIDDDAKSQIREKEEITKKLKILKEKIIKKQSLVLLLKEKVFYYETNFKSAANKELILEYRNLVIQIKKFVKNSECNLRYFHNLEMILKKAKKFEKMTEKLLIFREDIFKKMILKVYNKHRNKEMQKHEICAEMREILIIEENLNLGNYFPEMVGNILRERFFKICKVKSTNGNLNDMLFEWEFEILNQLVDNWHIFIEQYCILKTNSLENQINMNIRDILYNENYNEDVLVILRIYLEKIGEIFSVRIMDLKNKEKDKFDEYFKRYLQFCEFIYSFYRIRMKNELIMQILMDSELPDLKNKLLLCTEEPLLDLGFNFFNVFEDLNKKYNYAYSFNFDIFMRFKTKTEEVFYEFLNSFVENIANDSEISQYNVILEIIDEFNKKIEDCHYRMINAFSLSAENYYRKKKFKNFKENLKITEICVKKIISKKKTKINFSLKNLFELDRDSLQMRAECIKKEISSCTNVPEISEEVMALLNEFVDEFLEDIFRKNIDFYKKNKNEFLDDLAKIKMFNGFFCKKKMSVLKLMEKLNK